MIKMAPDSATQIKMPEGYCEIKNPARSAIMTKDTKRRCVRTVLVQGEQINKSYESVPEKFDAIR